MSAERAVSPSSYFVIDVRNVCFIEVKRYVSEMLLAGSVFGSEVQSENINFAIIFITFSTHESV